MSQTYIPSELRRLVRKRADECCEFCLIPESYTLASHEIDHVIAEKHGGATDESNLALACVICNKHKGSDLASIDPESGVIAPLYHPRQQRWSDHFRLLAGRIETLTATGRVTATLLRFNTHERIEERLLLVEAGVLTAPLARRST